MIRLAGVTKSYGRGRIVALDDVFLDLPANAFAVITGPSGSGKTTLLNVIAGLARPDRGAVTILDRDLRAMSERELTGLRGRGIGFIFQFPSLLPELSLLDNVRLQLRLAGRPDDPAACAALLAAAGLGDRLDARAQELSAGQQRRAAAARALVHRPRLILADEPTGDLDPDSAAAIAGLLQTAHSDGATVIMTTHDLGLRRLATHCFTLAAGGLAASGLAASGLSAGRLDSAKM